MEQDVGVLEDGFLTLSVSYEVRGEEALVETHTLGGLKGGFEGVGLLNGDDALAANLLHGLCNQATNLAVVCRDRCGCSDLVGRLDFLCVCVQVLNDLLNSGVNTALKSDRVCASCDVTQAFAYQCLRKDGRGGGSVTCDVVSLLGDFLYEFCADLFVRIFKIDFLSNGHAVLGNGGGAPLLIEDNIAALGAKRDLDSVSEDVQAALHGATCFLVKRNHLGHIVFLRCSGCGYPMPATDEHAGHVSFP